jgi:peptidyl-tRNA hydrolase ICT1
VPLDALLHHVPTALHGEIKRSRYVAAKANAMIVQADDSRKQSDNAHSCYQRLFAAIVEAGHHAVPNETSAEQSQRVKNLYVVRPGICPDDPTADKTQAKDR